MIAALLFAAALQFPAPDPAQSRSALTGVLLAHAVAQAADAITTRQAIARGGVEANPAMRWATDSTVKLALVKAAMTAGVSAALWWLHTKHPKVALVLGGFLTVGVSYVAFQNSRVAR